MKKFLSENWYKLMIGSSLLMASFGFMLHSVSPIYASDKKANSTNEKILGNIKGTSPQKKVNGPNETYYVIDSYNRIWWYQDGKEWTYWTTLGN